jgi:hypothetical protein
VSSSPPACPLPKLTLCRSCISARRRRTRNLRPYPLTGWAQGNQQGYYGAQHQQPHQQPPQGYQPPPPSYQASQGFYGGPAAKDNAAPTSPYGAPPPGSPPFASGAGSSAYPYGAQQHGVALAEPLPAHYGAPHGGNDDFVYEAPPGPPPGKGDGVVR